MHNGGDNTFMDAYMITGIPRFILLDKEGKIINAKMTVLQILKQLKLSTLWKESNQPFFKSVVLE